MWKNVILCSAHPSTYPDPNGNGFVPFVSVGFADDEGHGANGSFDYWAGDPVPSESAATTIAETEAERLKRAARWERVWDPPMRELY